MMNKTISQEKMQEIIMLVEQITEMFPKGFCDIPIIEDNYVFVPAIEFRRNPNTDEWTPI